MRSTRQGERGSANGRRRTMLMLLQAVLCSLSLGGCGGGGGGSSEVPQAAPGPASSPSSNPAPVPPPAGTADGTGIDFSFSLAVDRTTSAGVYASDGHLVRTLWRGERLAAGAHSRHWDQRDDAGSVAPSGTYRVKVVHHDVRYVWEGVIGNSSSRDGAAVLHRSYMAPTSLAAVPGGMLYAVGYNEGQSAINGFTLAQSQLNQSPVRIVDPFIAASMVATDGVRVYWANAGGMAHSTFVAAFDAATGSQAVFAAGTPVCLNYMADNRSCYAAQSYASVLDPHGNQDDPPTGLAVQASGPLLAVAYGADNQVHVFDKTTGALLRVLSVPLNAGASNQIAFAPNGDLWVLSPDGATRFGALSTAPVALATISTLARPLAITVDGHDDDGVWVADGGASQQLRHFDRSGALRQTLGQAGGCATQTAVSSERLCFLQSPVHEQTGIAVDDSHALWVIDTGNNRMLKLSATSGALLDQIAYLPAFYAMSVDAGNPSRVFANFLEFSVDHGRSLSDPKAWTLVRNWLPTLPAALRKPDSSNWTWAGFRTVVTLGNGRTYAVVDAQGRSSAIVELVAGGAVRFIGLLRDAGPGETNVVLYENGDLGYASLDGLRQSVLRLPLQGFDANGNPVWAATPTLLASGPASAGAPVIPPLTFTGVVGARFPVTSSGQVVFFNAAVDATSRFHLGAVPLGGSSWQFEASPSGPLDGLGSFQTHREDPTLQYGGNLVHAVGRDIVYGYHGEGYTDLGNHRYGEASQFMHFRDDGMFIGQFGVSSTRALAPSQAGLSGNAFSSTFLRIGTQTYLFHNDENASGGVHRWRLAGIDDIQELAADAAIGSAVALH